VPAVAIAVGGALLPATEMDEVPPEPDAGPGAAGALVPPPVTGSESISASEPHAAAPSHRLKLKIRAK
jgi:hypothetical protein